MGLREEVQSSYMALVESGNVRYQTQPAAAVGITIADDAAWDEIFDSTIVTVNFWLMGIQAIILGAGADVGLLVDVGSGGADGAAVAAATTLIADMSVFIDWASTVGSIVPPIIWLPIPIRVPASTRIAARIASSPTGTDVIDQFYVMLATAVGA